MRIDSSDINFIVKAITPFIKNNNAQLRLYGSRIDDNLKGGDIDLLLIAANEEVGNNLNKIKHKILVEIKENIGEQKIDLTICSQNNINTDPFLEHVFPDSISLHCWIVKKT